jgi:hypothetical protein
MDNTFRRNEEVVDLKTGKKVRVVDFKDDGFLVVRRPGGKPFTRYLTKLAKVAQSR